MGGYDTGGVTLNKKIKLIQFSCVLFHVERVESTLYRINIFNCMHVERAKRNKIHVLISSCTCILHRSVDV